MASQLELAWAIAIKDLKLELRRGYEVFSMIFFAAMSIIALSFGLPILIPEVTSYFVAPALWVVIIFTCLLGLSTVFIREYDTRLIDALRAAPVYPQTVFLGKMIYCFTLLGSAELILIPLSLIVFGIEFKSSPWLVLLLFLLGTLDFSVAGSLVSGMAMYTRSRLLVLPVLFFPLAMAALVPLVEATKLLFLGQPILRELGIIGLHLLTTLLTVLLVVEYIIEA